MFRRIVVCGAGWFASLAAANAATINVPADQPTIQGAVTATAAGDTIVVKSGTYSEVVSIPGGKNGLTIKGKGTCIVDCRPGGVASGPGFTVASTGVSIEGFTIRHANGVNSNGVFCAAGADGLHLEKLKIEHCDDEGFDLTANNVTVENCVLFGCGGGILITGNNVEVSKSVVRQDGGGGCTIAGTGAVVSKCIFKNIDGNAVDVSGSNTIVEKCVIDEIDADGIRIDGTNFSVRNNKILRMGDGEGIRLQNATTGLVEKNDVRNVLGNGIHVVNNLNGVTLRKNTVKDCGTDDDAGMFIDGPQCVVEKNVVTGGQSDGIRIGGVSCTVIDNESSGNGEDGIDIEADMCTISGNKASKNLAEGIENNNMATTLTGNTMKKNRIDLANDGTFATPPSGNSFTTGGVATPPEIDD